MRATQKKQSDPQSESQRRTRQILEDKKAMAGINEALAEVQRGERGTPMKDLKRKLRRA